MDLEIVILSEVRQRKRIWNLKRNDTSELIYEIERLTDFRELTYGYQGEERVLEFEADLYILLYLKRITNKDLLTLQHRELCSIICNNLDGKRILKRIHMCICIIRSLCYIPKTIITLLINSTPI